MGFFKKIKEEQLKKQKEEQRQIEIEKSEGIFAEKYKDCMIRDKLKSKEDFLKNLAGTFNTLANNEKEFENEVSELTTYEKRSKHGFTSKDLTRKDRLYSSLFWENQILLTNLYSLGAFIEELIPIAEQLVKMLPVLWIGSDTSYLGWILPLAVTLDLDKSYFEIIRTLWESGRTNGYRTAKGDFIVNFYLNYKYPNIDYKDKPILYPRPDNRISGIIKTAPEERAKKTKIYLEKYWFKDNNDYSLERYINGDIEYHGIWAFNIAAIVKILKIDDSDLKDTPYYPYDMVHYKEG